MRFILSVILGRPVNEINKFPVLFDKISELPTLKLKGTTTQS